MKYNNLTLQELLKLSPFDNKFNKPSEVSLQDFYSDFFVLIDEFIDEVVNIEHAINPDGIQFRPMYIISGYSGNGKTTLIHWAKLVLENKETDVLDRIKSAFKKEIEITSAKQNEWVKQTYSRFKSVRNSGRKYGIEIVNTVKEAHGFLQDKKLITASVDSELKEMFLESKVFDSILRNEKVFLRYFDRNIKNEKGEIEGNVWDRLLNLDHKRAADNLTYRDVSRWINDLNFQEKLLLFILEKIFRIKDKGLASYVLCFDNLDEISLEYLTNGIWREFLDIRDHLIYIFSNANFGFNFEFERKVIFLMIFREANLAVSNAQIFDRIWSSYEERRIILSGSGRKIAKRRLALAEKMDLDSSSKKTLNLLRILSADSYTDLVFLPLFNYDYRKLFHSTLELTETWINEGKECSMLSINNDEYQNMVLVELYLMD